MHRDIEIIEKIVFERDLFSFLRMWAVFHLQIVLFLSSIILHVLAIIISSSIHQQVTQTTETEHETFCGINSSIWARQCSIAFHLFKIFLGSMLHIHLVLTVPCSNFSPPNLKYPPTPLLHTYALSKWWFAYSIQKSTQIQTVSHCWTWFARRLWLNGITHSKHVTTELKMM
jgi:hypothetical protein